MSVLKKKPGVLSGEQYLDSLDDNAKCVEFVSLQDLKGAKAFGGPYDKLQEVAKTAWDILVIDEAHEGVDTYKTDVAFEHIHRKYTLHLSGTPFKALAQGEFTDDAIITGPMPMSRRPRRNGSLMTAVKTPIPICQG